MQIERLIREQVYLLKRRGRKRTIRRSESGAFNAKRLVGLLCLLAGLLLILSKCSGPKTVSEVSLCYKLCYATTNRSKEIIHENFWHWRFAFI